jgi:peroxiredoxin/tetratricopeptide (TPR) repeat protein
MSSPASWALACFLPLLAAPAAAQSAGEAAEREPGHSARGHAFDEGPRERPVKLDGLGKVHFPITTSVPEVQAWFDQGIALLHSFWYFEAERTFRWCVELDPECAMAYWGMAMSARHDEERFEALIGEAQRRKDGASEREQLYIEAWVGAHAPWLEGRFGKDEDGEERDEELIERLERLVVRYPDDIEAKAFTALAGLDRGSRIASEALIQQILAVDPEHPGAHHYRIHLWDESLQGDVALDSCARYGKIAWDVGHANHMPGHVYSGIGMWREAALWMESATRIELRQMRERGLFPYQYWNFAHNRNYLAYIQEQQGLVALALDGARTLLASPTDPDREEDQPDFVQIQGMEALVRCLLKFERWDEILREGAIPWDADDELHASWRAYAEALAHLGKGDVTKTIGLARELEEAADGDDWKAEGAKESLREVEAFLCLSTGRELEGLSEIEELAREQAEDFRRRDDPPAERGLFYTQLGELHLERGSARLAADCFRESLALVRNDGFALSGLARAEHALGNVEAATHAYGRLLHVWERADPGLRWMEAARALGLESEPIDESPAPQREYVGGDAGPLAKLGPLHWEPSAAPELAAVAGDGTTVKLSELRGKNVVLVFYLGGGCVHCVEELAALAGRAEEFAERDATILAVSADPADELAAPEELAGLDLRLLSDPEHVNARAFHAWDDFEDQALHATLLVDRAGRIRWKHVGAAPFEDVDLLLSELDRFDDEQPVAAAAAAGAARGGF